MRPGNKKFICASFGLALATILFTTSLVFAQTSVFTYQGRLTDGGTPANGNYDLQFALWDSNSGGTQIGAPQTVPTVAVSAGIFTVQLDFGANAFPGANRFLEISARLAGTSSFTTLAPRQQISSTPYAIRTLSAATADNTTNATNATTATNATQLGGVAASQYVQTTDSRLTDARVPTAGSSNYIQNNPASQQAGNFNISGNGTAGGTLSASVVNAATQYNIGGNRILSIAGTRNTFTGVGAGEANVNGLDNAFFGFNAGLSNNTGARNTFTGVGAGQANVNGHNSAFFGFNAGLSNTGTGGVNAVANFNSFFGANAGRSDTTGGFNSFFGAEAGSNSTTGNTNSFFGFGAGSGNAGDDNSFFGTSAGIINKGNRNSFFGVSAGRQSFFGDPDPPATGDDNSFFGNGAGAHNTTSGNSFFGSAAGGANTTSARNSFFGASAGINTDGGPDNADFLGADNSFFGYQAGKGNVGGFHNAFFGNNAGLNVKGDSNSFFGFNAGASTTSGSNNTLIGANTTAANGITGSTAIGANAQVLTNNTIVLGTNNQTVSATGTLSVGSLSVVGNVSVGGAINKLDVTGDALIRNNFHVIGTIQVGNIPNGQTNNPVCLTGGGVIGFCNSSLRYKTDVQPLHDGLDYVRRLRPVTYKWKANGISDLGLIAEEVNEVEPLLVTRNEKGVIEGVKYNVLNVVLINAIKEQQSQIETLRLENTALNARLRSVENVLRKRRVGSSRRRH